MNKVPNAVIIDPRTSRILGAMREQSMPIRSASIFNEICSAIEAAAANYEVERIESLKVYGQKDEAGELIVRENGAIDLADTDGFVNRINSFLSGTFDIPSLSIQEMGDRISVSPLDLDFLLVNSLLLP